jgi:hypothetical protein
MFLSIYLSAACDLAFDARHSFVEAVELAGAMEAVVRAWHHTVAWSAVACGGGGAHVARHPTRVPYRFSELHMRPELARETTCELAV